MGKTYQHYNKQDTLQLPPADNTDPSDGVALPVVPPPPA